MFRTAVVNALRLSLSSSSAQYASRRMLHTVTTASVPRLTVSSVLHSRVMAQRVPLPFVVRSSYATEVKDEEELGEVKEEKSVPSIEVDEDEDIPVEPKQEPVPETLIKETEVAKGTADSFEFQAETRKLLHIVAESLYTEKEVFLRELVSNAADAMEKLRHLTVLGTAIEQPDLELEINISADEKANTLIIQDTGIGMTREELVENLGKIGHSGSLDFLKKVGKQDQASANIIGQFGVGFYSAFMVGNKLKVYTRSHQPNSTGYLWESDGTGSYTIREAENVQRGTKIIIDLKDNAKLYAKKLNLQNIIKKYSNFVGFPIKINGVRTNTISAIWTRPKSQVTEEEHKEFYQFVANAFDAPTYRLHFATDSPINVRGLFYLPSHHMERFGVARLEPGINLFNRKVLIQPKAKGLLPEWLRFVKGVVDSEEIPLNLSREHLQDSSLIARINQVITKRILKFIDEEARADPAKYSEWYNEFANFFKEGACTDHKWKEEIAKLLRYESSATEKGKFTSLEEYVSRMKSTQKDIFYVLAHDRAVAEQSPYYESFKKAGIEVLFVYSDFDEVVFHNVQSFNKKNILSIESPKADPGIAAEASRPGLSQDEVADFSKWLRDTLSDRVTTVKESTRLVDTPAIVVGHEPSSVRRMMRAMQGGVAAPLPKQQLEFNPAHPLIVKLNSQRPKTPLLAKQIAEQIMDNALVAANLIEDTRIMIPRLNQLLLAALERENDLPSSPTNAKTTTDTPSEPTSTTTSSS